MRNWMTLTLMATLVLSLAPVRAQENAEQDLPKVTVREVFVPDSEMSKLLENCKDRVLLSREEFESLLIESLQQQKVEPEAEPPVASVLLSSDLNIVITEEQAKIKAVFEWDSHTEKLHGEPLTFDAVAIQSAMLNGQPAKIGFVRQPETQGQSSDENRYTLFWQGKGRQRLELELTTALMIDSVRQELAFNIPRAPKATETLIVPGDVELKSGAMILSRKVEGEAENRRTHFELLPNESRQHLVLTLNSHRTRMIKSVLAKSVQFAEVTEHYEKLHATFSLNVLHQPIESAEFVVPMTFDITEVNTPQLARWGIIERDGQSILEVRFREPVSNQVPINLTAVHFFESETPAEALAEWSFPAFEPLNVDANTTLFGLLVDAGWNVHKIEADRLIAIGPQILTSTIPESVFRVGIDAPTVRTVAAWYAPSAENWRIVCEFLKPEPIFDVVSHQVLTLNDREQTMRGLMQVAPRYEKLFELKISVPQSWTVKRVTDESDTALPFEQKDDLVRIKVKSGIAPGTVFPVFFEASGNTTGWFGDWSEQRLAFPCFSLLDAASDRGTIAVDVDEDMVITSENDVRLVPLDGKERTEFLAGVPTDLAFRYLSRPYSTDLHISRATPRLTARTYAFFGCAPSLLSARYELHYTVEQAKAKSLAFLLPLDTPENIGIRGQNMAIKDYSRSETTVDGKQYRRWDVQLADPMMGHLILNVDFEQATPDETTLSLPLISTDDVAWQTGLVSVEGHEELNLTLVQNAGVRQVDVGELAATQYIPGRRLLGVFEGVTDAEMLKVDVKRNPDFQLPPSLVQLARGEVEIAADGKRINRAIYDLKTRATFLKIDLAKDEEIWAVSLDGKTIKPQKSGAAVMVDIPARDDAILRELEIVWATGATSRSPGMFSRSDIRLPDLMIPQNAEKNEAGKDDKAKETEITWKKIPVTRIAWNVTAPPSYEVTRIGNHRVMPAPRPIVLQYLGKMFASSDKPRERRSFGFGCSAPGQSAMTKDSASIEYFSAASMADAPADDSAWEPENHKRSKSRSQADFGEMIDLIKETVDADSWKDENGESAEKSDVVRLRQDSASAPQDFFDGEISDFREGKTGDLSKAVDSDSDSGLVGRFTPAEQRALPYQKQTLQTVRPVQVQFQQNLSAPLQRHTQFQLVGGSESQLNVRMVDTRIVTFGMYLVWGAVLCAGLYLLKASRRVRALYVLAVFAVGTLLVLVPRLEMFAVLFDEAVKAGFWVFVIYLLTGGYRMFKQRRAQTDAATVIVLCAVFVSSLVAQANDATEKPLDIPGDVVVAFYDAESLLVSPLLKDGLPDPKVISHPDQKLLVPYAKYIELWNLTHPDEKIEPVEKPPVDYLMTFGQYNASLTASEELTVTGKIEIDVLSESPILFPLPIGQGILTSLQVDGKSAEISINPQSAQPLGNEPVPQQQQMAQQQPDPQQQMIAPPRPQIAVFVLQIHGKGSHVIELTAKYKVQRQGGWRLVNGQLPEIAAGKVLLQLPEERMELRCSNVYAQQKWQAATSGETIETSLGRDGRFNWSWRSKVTEGEIDQSLTADSELRFNVQEDSLVLDWDLTLAFRRGKHESFRVRIPADYLVVSISGENVRGWENAESDSPNEALIDVELLHAAQETERFNIALMRTADFENAKDTTVTTPNVGVVGAAMHHGRVTLQNSPRLDIKTMDVANASMTDLPETQNRSDTGKNLSDNPFGLKTYRSYRFTTENYRLPLAVNLLQAQPICTMRNIVKLAPYELKLESNYQLYSSIQSESRFSERLILPLGMQLDSVTSELPIEWSTKPLESGKTELTVIWSVIPNSRHVQFNIHATAMREEGSQANLCVILPQDSKSVRHEFVIQSDPAFDVALHEKTNLHESPQMSLHWIVEAQRPFCRKELSATTNNNGQNVPSAKLSLIPREPVISSESITNVQVNSRSIEETILLDFNIQNAGIRSVEFELPKSMADAKINAPLLQRKEIVADENGDSVRVTLRLQDEIMNEFRVLIRSNHELVSGKTYRTTIPKIKTDNVLNQFIVLENAGSLDELKVDETKLVGMQRISRQNKEWNNLAAILGDGATDAYLVSDQTKPQLAFNMVRRETVKMSGARIGLAETRVVLGESGDYLAEQIYRIDNKTEQFLDLKLPKGAELWTVRILTNQEWEAKQSGAAGDFGQPVKPTKLPKTDASGKVSDMPSGVRIPIIKTEVGDLDYVVRIVYAGKCGPIRWASKLDIPFIEVLNIPVGASYARLHLPEDYKFRFDGTMTQSDQGAVAKTISEYDKQVNAKLQQAAQTGNPYEQARALSNLSLKGMLPEMPLSSSRPGYDQRGARSYTVTPPVYETQTGQMMGRRSGYEMQNDSEPFFLSNDVQLEQRFAEQSNRRSQNVVVQSDSNWKVEHAPSTAVVTDESGQAFNRQWLGKNNLENPLNNDKKAESAYNQPAPASQMAAEVERSEERLPQAGFGAYQANESRSSRVNADNRGVQQAPVMALQGQERLRDSGLASKLSNSQMPALSTTQPSRPASQAEMATMGGKPQQQAPADNLALYQRRLAAQNADSNLTVNGANIIPMETPVPSEFGGGMAGQGGGYGGGPGGMSGGQAAGRSAASSSGVVVEDAFSNSVKNSSPLAGLNAYREESQHISGEIAVYASPLADPQNMAACEPVSGGTTVMGTFDSPVMSTTMAVKAASLDIEIPNTGTVYFFTAPQAENRLSLSGVSASTSQRTKDFGYVAGMLAVCGLVGFLVVRRKRAS